VTKNSAEVTWYRPSKDGGAPIQGYIVEKRKIGTDDWVTCNAQPVKVDKTSLYLYSSNCLQDTRLVVGNLTERDEYEFRVKAVNSAGPGEPSRPSDVVIIQEQAGRPCLDLSALKDITVRAGQPFTIKIPYSGGNPKPTADFFNGNKVILDDDRVKIEVKLI
jgi:hypothetical protein